MGMVEQRRMGYQLEAGQREEDSKRVEVGPERGEMRMALEPEQEEGELVLVMGLEVVVKVVVEEREEVGKVVAVLEVVAKVVEEEPAVVGKVVVVELEVAGMAIVVAVMEAVVELSELGYLVK